MTKEKMLSKIYEVIADKTLSLGCICYDNENKQNIQYQYIYETKKFRDNMKIIGHPVMIGDVLDWWSKQPSENTPDGLPDMLYRIYWKELRLPIEAQNIECITFIYNLITNDN